MAFVVSAMLGRVRVPTTADVEGIEITPLGRTDRWRQIVTEGSTALGRLADSLSDFLADPLPRFTLSFR
jgi:hypothetical protein